MIGANQSDNLAYKSNDNDGENKALRYNEGKNQLSLLTPHTLREWCKVLEYGAKKYNRYNWQKGGKGITEYIDSAFRHLLEIMDGNDVDVESKCLHAAHIICNMQFIIELSKSGKIIEDRILIKESDV